MVTIAGQIADRHLGVRYRCLDHRFDIAGVHRHPKFLPFGPRCLAAARRPRRFNLARTPFWVTRSRIILTIRSRRARRSHFWRLQPADQKAGTMRLPGPDHPITITENPKRVRVSLDGVVIAET